MKDIYEDEWIRIRLPHRKFVPDDPACEICHRAPDPRTSPHATAWFSIKTKRIRCIPCFKPKRPVREVYVYPLNVERMRQEAQAKEREQQLQRALGLQLINIGYKVLATKLHPDKGGSREAMTRLNKVRDMLRGAL